MRAKTYKDKKGYLRFKDSGKYVHLWVAGKKYGKEATNEKEIHHIDGDRTNNDKSNLILLTKEDHWHLSKYERRKRFVISIIIILALFYLIIINLLMYTSFLNMDTSLALARLSVFAILIVSLELKYGWIEKWIRKPSENQGKE